MEQLNTGICIIGAGPAGVLTSLMLSKNGIKSILIDKETFPRYKACADCITGNTIRIVKEIDPDLIKGLVAKEDIVTINGVYAYSSSLNKLKVPFKNLEKDLDEPSCYGISRLEFDNHLINLAKKDDNITVIENFNASNVYIKNEKAFVKELNGKTIIADLLVVANGSNSILSEQLGKFKKQEKHTAVGIRGYFRNVTMPYPNYCELFLFRKLMPGGAYLTPLPNNMVNMNLVVRMDKLKKHKIDLKETLNEYINKHPIFKERFKDAQLVGNLQGSTLRLGTKKRKIAGDHFVLVGDAAGLVDLLSANGLPQACMSAKIAAKHLTNAIKNNNFKKAALIDYEKEVHHATANYLKLSKIVSPFFKSEWFLNLFDFGLNFITKKSAENEAVEDLVYKGNAVKSLINPLFYRKLFFGLKNSSSS
ncbi:MAG: NAD(P)/FAD-dependent oxidoreductase [Sphingobacteriia bacterium]